MAITPVQKQNSPDQQGCTKVLVEGKPAVVLGSVVSGEEIAPALPRVLVGGQPIAVISSGHGGAATVLGAITNNE